MRVILGIGNPGSRYKYNRHNVGFMLLDYFANKFSISFNPSKGDFYFAEGIIEGFNYTLIKPTTYVNNSGIAALDVVEKYGIDITNLLVVCDDINLSLANLRIRASGGDGGHNGLSSVIYHLSSNKFPRLRIGIGDNFKNGQLADYVLEDFNKGEFKVLEKCFDTGIVLIEEFIKGGIKHMLDANSRLYQSDSNNNILNQ